MNLDAYLQNIEQVGEKFAIATRPSDVISRIHVYAHLVSVANQSIFLCYQDVHVRMVECMRGLTLSARLATSVDIYNKRDANISFDPFSADLFFASSE